MRPKLRFLTDDLIQRIVSEARDVLDQLGVEINNPQVVDLLADHGARVDRDHNRVHIPAELIDRALQTTPASFTLHDVFGEQTHDLGGDRVHFTPGSAAINWLDHRAGQIRPATTSDYVDYVKVVSGLPHIASQSTAVIPADVHERISDSYRLFLSLIWGTKPVVTGAFTAEAFDIMRDLQLAIRGSEGALAELPLTIFSCCPTAPLKWSHATSQNVFDCARYNIPVEYISMPLTGFVAPVTLVGALVQHTAETLSGIVITQHTRPGAPALYGGSPAAFDVRYETTPMGAIETMMIDCAYNEIGKSLGLPTQAYIGLSDAKRVDAQAGAEAANGTTLAALAGINNISGPGMIDFESCLSLENLVLDNELCGMALRMLRGIEPRDDFPAIPHFTELLQEGHLLISAHTRKHLRTEHTFPGPVIDRANRARWQEEGGLLFGDRARREVDRLIADYQPSVLPDTVKRDLEHRMRAEARRFGMDQLPHEKLCVPS